MRVWVLALALSLTACGQTAGIEVRDAWARDTVGGTANAAVFMTIDSPTADRLVGASTPAARETSLMTMQSAGGAMSMAYLDAIDIPGGERVSLDPSGLHVWLADLPRPLKAGESIPLVLEFEKAGAKRVTVSVHPHGSTGPGGT